VLATRRKFVFWAFSVSNDRNAPPPNSWRAAAIICHDFQTNRVLSFTELQCKSFRKNNIQEQLAAPRRWRCRYVLQKDARKRSDTRLDSATYLGSNYVHRCNVFPLVAEMVSSAPPYYLAKSSAAMRRRTGSCGGNVRARSTTATHWTQPHWIAKRKDLCNLVLTHYVQRAWKFQQRSVL